ncbi:MAG: four helix bundle protein [Filimonas sp.]|nr:four helix bundle protein [Filimonas sp.]
MATIQRFEDLPLWQLSRTLCNDIFKLVKESILFQKDMRFRDQIKAAAGSVMDNIAEGFERSSRLEFINFLGIAKGSSGEVRSQLHRAVDNNYVEEAIAMVLIKKYEQLSKEIAGFIKYLNSTVVKGQKFNGRRT